MILDADWGGQILLTTRARHVACAEQHLQQLLLDLNVIAWQVTDGEGAALMYEPHLVGDSVIGGMGGGEVTDGTWIHPRLLELGIADEIHSVISGGRERLSRSARRQRMR